MPISMLGVPNSQGLEDFLPKLEGEKTYRYGNIEINKGQIDDLLCHQPRGKGDNDWVLYGELKDTSIEFKKGKTSCIYFGESYEFSGSGKTFVEISSKEPNFKNISRLVAEGNTYVKITLPEWDYSKSSINHFPLGVPSWKVKCESMLYIFEKMSNGFRTNSYCLH